MALTDVLLVQTAGLAGVNVPLVSVQHQYMVTEKIADRAVALPFHTHLTDGQIEGTRRGSTAVDTVGVRPAGVFDKAPSVQRTVPPRTTSCVPLPSFSLFSVYSPS